MRSLVFVLVALVVCVLPSISSAQSVLVRFQWSQPDSTLSVEVMEGDSVVSVLPGVPLPEGHVKEYHVFLASPTDTLEVGIVGAPYDPKEEVSVTVPIDLNQESSVAVQAVDHLDRPGPMSKWSDPLTVRPGPPGRSYKPRVTEVILNKG